jgi:hypothetical protein
MRFTDNISLCPLSDKRLSGAIAAKPKHSLWCLRDMRISASRAKWTILLTILSTAVMLGILALFYATDHKPLAMRLMRAVNPTSSILPWLTQGMRPTLLTVRLYDFLVVFAMAFQGFLMGAAIDVIRWVRRPGKQQPLR